MAYYSATKMEKYKVVLELGISWVESEVRKSEGTKAYLSNLWSTRYAMWSLGLLPNMTLWGQVAFFILHELRAIIRDRLSGNFPWLISSGRRGAITWKTASLSFQCAKPSWKVEEERLEGAVTDWGQQGRLLPDSHLNLTTAWESVTLTCVLPMTRKESA